MGSKPTTTRAGTRRAGQRLRDSMVFYEVLKYLSPTGALLLQGLSRRDYERNIPRCSQRYELDHIVLFCYEGAKAVYEYNSVKDQAVKRYLGKYRDIYPRQSIQVKKNLFWLNYDGDLIHAKPTTNGDRFAYQQLPPMKKPREYSAFTSCKSRYIYVSGGVIKNVETNLV